MNINNHRNLVLIPWLALPIVLASYLLLWAKIPLEIGVHFTFSGDFVTSMSRAGYLLFCFITLLLVLSICSWKVSRSNKPNRLLVRYYFAIIALTIIFLGILFYNIYRPLTYLSPSELNRFVGT